jgi:hypothetical protein
MKKRLLNHTVVLVDPFKLSNTLELKYSSPNRWIFLKFLWILLNFFQYISVKPGQRRWYSDYATVWTVRCWNPGRRKRRCASPNRPEQLWGPLSLLFSRYRGCFQGVKRTDSNSKHSSVSSAVDKKAWRHTSSPFKRLHGTYRKTFLYF